MFFQLTNCASSGSESNRFKGDWMGSFEASSDRVELKIHLIYKTSCEFKSRLINHCGPLMPIDSCRCNIFYLLNLLGLILAMVKLSLMGKGFNYFCYTKGLKQSLVSK